MQKKNEVKKAKKMKRLSLVKTPEAVKKKLGASNASNAVKNVRRINVPNSILKMDL